MLLKSRRSLKAQPVVSGVLVAVNVIVFMAATFYKGALYDMGMLKAVDVLVKGEYGRILWAVFLHADITHLFNNMFLLFFLGAMIEKEIGHVKYALVYFLSGIGGNLLSLTAKVMTNDFSASLGASGAIFGLDGTLLAMVLFSGRKMENVTPVRVLLMIAYSLYSGFTGANIDNAAHVGGLLTGFVITALLCGLRHLKQHSRQSGEQM